MSRAPRRRRRDPTPAQRAQARRSLGFNPGATGIEAEQRKAAQRSDRARQTAPAMALPHVPVIRNPTHEQTVAAHTVIAHAINRHVTGRTPREQQASRNDVIHQVQSDPRYRDFLRASQHYARVQEHSFADTVAQAAGVRGPRGQRIRAGRALIAQARRRNPGAHPGAPPRRVGVGPATISVPGLQRAIAAGTSLDTGDLGERRFAGRLAGDVGSLATGPFVGGYEAAAGVNDLVQGRGPGRLEHLGEGIVKGTYDTFRHPEQSFRDHPLLTGLTFAGGVGAVGRVGGAVSRGLGSTAESAGIRGGLARAGSTVRPAVAFSEDAAGAGIRQRSYSKDLSRKAVQVMQDRAREPLTHPDGTPVTVMDRGREVPVLKATERERESMGRKQGDFLASRANAAERQAREQVNREMKVRGVKGKTAKDLVAMVTEGTITSAEHFESDLKAYRDMVDGEVRRHEENVRAGQDPIFHDRQQVKDAKATVARIDRVLKDKRVIGQKERIVDVGTAIGRKLNESEAEAIKGGVLHGPRAKRARLIHPAVLHAGARHYTSREAKALRKAGVEVSDEFAKHGGLRTPEGRFLADADIENALRAKGRDPASVAYLPPGALGRRAFHARFNLSRPTIGGAHSRTGEQFRRGLTTVSAEGVREQGTKLAVQLEKARALDRVVSEHGMKHPTGRYFTGAEAEEYAKRLEADTGERLTAVRAVPAKAGAKTEALARAEQDPTAMENLGQRLLNDRLNVKPGTKNVVLMPSSLVERLKAHAAPTAPIVRMFQALNKPFRFAVLAQPRWLTGNFVEPFLVRLPTVGSGVNVFGLGADLRATSQVLKSFDRQAGELEDVAAQWGEHHEQLQHGLAKTQAQQAAATDAMRVLKIMRTARRGGTENERAVAWGKAQTIAERHGIHIPSIESVPEEAQAAYIRDLEQSVTQQYGAASAAGRRAQEARNANIPAAAKLRQAAREVRGQQTGGGLFVGGRGASVRRSLEEMPGAKVWGPVIAKTPVVHQMVEFTRMLGHGLMAPGNLYFRMNRVIEDVANRASFGHNVRRDVQQFTGSWTKTIALGQKAADEAARGLVNTPTQRRFMDQQHELLGKYDGQSPAMRALTQTIFPFLPWMLNSARFVFWTLPVHNTVKTALLLQTNEVVKKDQQEIHKDVPPGSLKYAIPNGKGGWIDLARYTPFGAFTEAAGGGGYGAFAGQFAPQISGTVSALEGRDPFGRDLTAPKTAANPTGKANPLTVAVNQAAESMIPYLATARRLRERGGTAYSSSTLLDPQVKPGTDTQMGALRRTFDPLRPTYLRTPASASAPGPAASGAQGLLERAAHRNASGGLSQRQLDLLERAAQRAAGG